MNPTTKEKGLLKCLTGINGLDEITNGGIPKGRPTLICGNAGCGKTLLSMEFIVRGAREFDEPGVFMSFEENEDDLIQNFESLGFNISGLMDRKKMIIDYVYIERSEIEETGEYDLDGLFIRLENAIDTIGARRVVLDTIEALFSGFRNESILRAELRRLFRWLKNKGVTAIITGESGDQRITKYGLEEYVADCVILLDHRIKEQIATRRMKIIKYRGSNHGMNEYPFIIGDDGISVLPITSLSLDFQVSAERISTGIETLDNMLGKKGIYKGSSVLISGTAGTGKTSFCSHFAENACENGLKSLFFIFEESPHQLMRNVKNIGIDLQRWFTGGLLRFEANRPSHFGLEMHLVKISSLMNSFRPDVVILDSITNMISLGPPLEVKSMLIRLMDLMKKKQITSLFTDLAENYNTEIGISSLTDTLIKLENKPSGDQIVRTISIVKSRGMDHSDRVKKFIISEKGVKIMESDETLSS